MVQVFKMDENWMTIYFQGFKACISPPPTPLSYIQAKLTLKIECFNYSKFPQP